MSKRVFFVVVLLLTTIICHATEVLDKPAIVEGVLDLRNGKLQEYKEIDFSGEWEFYWQKLLGFTDFDTINYLEPTCYINVPDVWNIVSDKGKQFPKYGYATYRIKVLVDTLEPMAIKFGSISTAFNAYVDDKLIRSAGVVSVSKELAKPGYSTGVSFFYPSTRAFNIIIQVSNYHYSKAGIWNDISKIGLSEPIQNSWGSRLELLLLFIGSIFIIAIYHLGLFLLNRSFKSALFFAAFCILIGARALIINEIYLLKLLPNFNWALLIKIEYLTILLGTISFMLFIDGVYIRYRIGKLSNGVILINSLLSFVVLFTSVSFFTKLLYLVQFALLLGISYVLIIVIKALFNHERSARILFIGLLVLVITIINDLLYVNRVIDTSYLVTYGFMFFILSQAYLIGYQYQEMFNEAKSSALALEKTNIGLENKVLERTREIQDQNKKLLSQNDEIKTQRDYVKQQHKVLKQHQDIITDSINYAEKIQNAVLPSSTVFEGHLHDYFVFYKPRDIVSGDFYWFSKKDNKIIVVAADCTGHGVPGAFMSMLGVAFLAEIIRMSKVKTPAQILELLREKVKQSLNQYDKNNLQREGMDIALCMYDPDAKVMEFAGAYSPLYIIRNNELIIYKGDRQPVAVYQRERNFTNHVIKIEPEDRFYIFSDGFADQISGGPVKKFTVSRFKNLLLKIHKKPMQEQKDILEKTFIDWSGTEPQIDDVLVIGFQIR